MAVIRCCKDCADRYVGCHAKCEKYKIERALLNEAKERKRKESIVDNYAVSSSIASMNIVNRRHGRKYGGALNS